MTDTVIVPDNKDWTWVVGRACPECGADVSSILAESVAQEIRDNADAWEEVLWRDPGELRRRPRPDRWSALEYAAHVRDVYVLYRQRLRLMMECDDPLYPNWDQDAASKSYRGEDPGHIANGLSAAAEALAILEQAYAYYQPEPVLVHDADRVADEEPGTCAYYQAA